MTRGASDDSAVEYDVLCPSDGKLRGASKTYEDAEKVALWRDKDCGRCHPPDGRHVVVSREVSDWTPAEKVLPPQGRLGCDALTDALTDAIQKALPDLPVYRGMAAPDLDDKGRSQPGERMAT